MENAKREILTENLVFRWSLHQIISNRLFDKLFGRSYRSENLLDHGRLCRATRNPRFFFRDLSESRISSFSLFVICSGAWAGLPQQIGKITAKIYLPCRNRSCTRDQHEMCSSVCFHFRDARIIGCVRRFASPLPNQGAAAIPWRYLRSRR